MILLEMIIAALNQNQVKIETAKASSFVEREIVAWLHRLVFNRTDKFYENNIQNPRVALGNVTSDGTFANLTALLVAREKAFPPEKGFTGLRMAGMDRALRHYDYKRGVIIVSTRGHYSIKKAANILGIGEENVLNIPVDEFNRIDLGRLKRRIKSLKQEKGKERLLEWKEMRISSSTKNAGKELERRVRKANHIINALNIKLHKALRKDNTTFVSRTSLESTCYRPQNIIVLRAVLINPLTNRDILEEIVATQNRIGLGLWPEFEPVFQKLLKGPQYKKVYIKKRK